MHIMAPCPVILLADRSIPNVATIAKNLEEGLADVVEFLSEDADPSSIALAIAIGGDGTLISQGRNLAEKNIPLIGVNSGRLGFLAKFDTKSLIEHRKSIFASDTPTMEVMLLEVRVDDQEPVVAMNEAMIAAGNPFRILELGLSINNVPAPTLRCDGMILSTPIGSTAHNASVGGPLVDPSAKAFVLTPLAAHSPSPSRPSIPRTSHLPGARAGRIGPRRSASGTGLPRTPCASLLPPIASPSPRSMGTDSASY